ncbi:MAG: hypothetical protein KAX86_06900 [Anaerolineales bacterium]|nr:hypothetical protein [Anaerolineales bacterium]
MKTCHQTRMMFLRILILTLIAGIGSSCAFMDNLNATPTPVNWTATPSPTPTIIWFPPSATPSPAAFLTQAPTPEMRPGIGRTFLTDDFSDEDLWGTSVTEKSSAAIDNNRLNLSAQSREYIISLRKNLSEDNYYAEITARPNLCRADDSYGILVRASDVAYFRFSLYCNGTVGAERISRDEFESLQKPLPSGDVPPGAPGEVRIGVWSVGREIRLFLNGRFQFSINNTNFPIGSVGVFVNSAGDNPVIVSFSDLTLQQVDYQP